MPPLRSSRLGFSACVLASIVLTLSCGPGPQTPVAEVSTAEATAPRNQASEDSSGATDTATNAAPETKRRYQPIQLGGASASGAGSTAINEQRTESVMAAMHPLQVLLGKWNGTSRKAELDQPEWIWDLQTDRSQPSLFLKSSKSKYIREARLTFVPADQKFQLKLTDAAGQQRTLRGDFTQPVQDVAGDDKKLQRTFRLQFQEQGGQPDDVWQVSLQQLENNRYLLELDRKRGNGPFQRVDTVHTQREGTSFAVSDTDYGDKTCIISQGLGTISVSYKGQSYWVCCTGCKAAFEEDPARWIAKFEERKKAMTKDQ